MAANGASTRTGMGGSRGNQPPLPTTHPHPKQPAQPKTEILLNSRWATFSGNDARQIPK